MSFERDFQNIGTEMISVFALIDGICDSHDHEKKLLLRTFLDENARRVQSLYALTGESLNVTAIPGDLRKSLRDQLFDMLCLLDEGDLANSTPELLSELHSYLNALRAFARTVDINNTLVQ
jgi:hypothetical protein